MYQTSFKMQLIGTKIMVQRVDASTYNGKRCGRVRSDSNITRRFQLLKELKLLFSQNRKQAFGRFLICFM